jgi:hypothetical protein
VVASKKILVFVVLGGNFTLLGVGNDGPWAIVGEHADGIQEERVIAFAEDFEGLALGPNVDERTAGDEVWTETPPAGWVIDESGVPGAGNPANDGVTEWAGWAFTNRQWWTQTAGDQNRSQFTLGVGTIAVADPDEWDDAGHPAGSYNTYLTTPAIHISGFGAGTVQLRFDSSWRPEVIQTANITVQYDGGDPMEVLRWESQPGANFKDDNSTNETIIVDLGNPPGATSVVLTFGLFDAGNNWWWAIDNVEVSGLHRERVVVLCDGNIAVEEGGAMDRYEIVLNSEPTRTVRITATPGDAQIDLGSGPGVPVILDFATSNWDVSQTVSVTAVDDNVYEGEIPRTTNITHTAVSGDEDYEGIYISSVKVEVVDNELTCGDWGYLPGDLNKDCYVNLADFAIFVEQWLKTSND